MLWARDRGGGTQVVVVWRGDCGNNGWKEKGKQRYEGRVEDSLGSLMRRTVFLRMGSQHPG